MREQGAALLRRFRLRARLTQEELAERSGVSARTIRGWETGTRRNPQLASLRRTADALDLAPDERDELVAAALGATTIPAPAAKVSPPPRQLPAAPCGFIGRDAELADLTHALDTAAGTSPTVVVTALAGAGGIGKTWLALHWAHQHQDRFPDGHLFVDLRGFSPDSGPVEPLTAVRGFLDALGVDPARITSGLAEHTAMYRSLVADKRILIVLDNAATTDQVEPLLPGSTTCGVVVTSRKTLTSLITRHGARHLPLSILGQNEAHALLVERLGEARVAVEPDAAQDLIRLCGRYPLALALIASRAYIRPQVPLAEFGAELRELGLGALEDDVPAASLPAVLSWSLRGLTTQQRTVFGLLGIAPGPSIGLPAAVSLTGLPEPRVRKALRDLEEASLLDRLPGGRHSMHDLIRDYATDTAHQELAEQARKAALRRVVDFYAHTADTAHRFLDPHRPPMLQLDPPAPGCQPHPLPDHAVALAWFDTEHAGLLAAQHTATTYGWHRVVWNLACSLDAFHHRRGHRHDQLAVWLAGLAAAEHLPDPTALARAHIFLGGAYAILGRHGEAIEHLHQAVALAEQHHDPVAQARAQHSLALAWGQQGDDGRALEHAAHALPLYRTLNNPVWEANGLNVVGWYAARLGEYDRAREHCQASLTLRRRHHDPLGEANTLDSLGYIDHHTGQHDQAIVHYRQALALYRDLGHAYHLATTLDWLGDPHAALGQHDQARTVWREAEELYRAQQRTQDAERVQRQLDVLDHHPDSQ